MAKTIIQCKTGIQKQRDVIKKAEQIIAKLEASINQIEERELIELARQIKAAGKLDDARELISKSDSNFSKLITTPQVNSSIDNEKN